MDQFTHPAFTSIIDVNIGLESVIIIEETMVRLTDPIGKPRNNQELSHEFDITTGVFEDVVGGESRSR